MIFSKFIYIVGFIWFGYYLFVVLFDLLKSSKPAPEVTTHHVQFESKNPVVINDESFNTNKSGDSDKAFDSHTEYLPKDDINDLKSTNKKNWVTVDLGLETISGEAYEVSAENLSKYIRV